MVGSREDESFENCRAIILSKIPAASVLLEGVEDWPDDVDSQIPSAFMKNLFVGESSGPIIPKQSEESMDNYYLRIRKFIFLLSRVGILRSLRETSCETIDGEVKVTFTLLSQNNNCDDVVRLTLGWLFSDLSISFLEKEPVMVDLLADSQNEESHADEASPTASTELVEFASMGDKVVCDKKTGTVSFLCLRKNANSKYFNTDTPYDLVTTGHAFSKVGESVVCGVTNAILVAPKFEELVTPRHDFAVCEITDKIRDDISKSIQSRQINGKSVAITEVTTDCNSVTIGPSNKITIFLGTDASKIRSKPVFLLGSRTKSIGELRGFADRYPQSALDAEPAHVKCKLSVCRGDSGGSVFSLEKDMRAFYLIGTVRLHVCLNCWTICTCTLEGQAIDVYLVRAESIFKHHDVTNRWRSKSDTSFQVII